MTRKRSLPVHTELPFITSSMPLYKLYLREHKSGYKRIRKRARNYFVTYELMRKNRLVLLSIRLVMEVEERLRYFYLEF